MKHEKPIPMLLWVVAGALLSLVLLFVAQILTGWEPYLTNTRGRLDVWVGLAWSATGLALALVQLGRLRARGGVARELETSDADPSARRTALMIWSAMLVMLATCIAGTTAARAYVKVTNSGGRDALALTAAGMTAVCALVSPALLRSALHRVPPSRHASTRTVVSSGLWVGVGAFDSVAWMLTSSLWTLAGIACAVVYMLLAFPSQGKWGKAVRMQGRTRESSR